MNGERGTISPSLRWSVFARDGFTCRYCGAQAGQPGVELHADHLVSVAEGGDESYDNLVTACLTCNGGKGARSLKAAPCSAEVIQRTEDRTKLLSDQAAAMAAAMGAQQQVKEQATALKRTAYGDRKHVSMGKGEESRIITWCRNYGADNVLEWYSAAYRAGVRPRYAVRYVCGCIKNHRTKEAAK